MKNPMSQTEFNLIKKNVVMNREVPSSKDIRLLLEATSYILAQDYSPPHERIMLDDIYKVFAVIKHLIRTKEGHLKLVG